MKELNNYTCRTHNVLSKQLQMLWRTAMMVVTVFLFNSTISEAQTPCTGPCDLRTQTQGGWGANPSGNNPGAYLHANFAAAFPDGVMIGDVTDADACEGFSLTLTSATAVTAFLPSGSTPRALDANYTNTDSYSNVLAGQAVALTISIGFDNMDPAFGADDTNLEDAIVAEGTFEGWTVAEVLAEANRALAGCGSEYSFSQLNDALSSINESYVDGTRSSDFLMCELPTPDAPTLVAVHPTCTEATGSITITSSTTGLMFSVNGAEYVAYPASGWMGLAPGTYEITARNEEGCISAAATIVINEQPATPAMPTLTVTQPTCTEATGSIMVTAPMGEGYQYSINDGDTWQSGTAFTGLAAGTYTVWVMNAAGCMTESGEVRINEQPAMPAMPTLTVTQPTCTSAGSIMVTAPTGTGMEYSINDGETWQSGTMFANVAAGTYTIWVRNAAGCMTESNEVTINPMPTMPAAPTVTVTQPTCTEATGSIMVTAPMGEGYQYSINDGDTWQRGTAFTGLAAGTYTVWVMNAAGCMTESASIMINPPSDALTAPVLAVVNPTCVMATGMLQITSSTTGLMFSVNGDAYVAYPASGWTGLAAGTYTVTARNEAGCVSASVSIMIKAQPTAPAMPTLTVTQPTCINPAGTIMVTGPTGEGMMYSMNGGEYQAGTMFSNLAPGNYTITVRNSSGCVSPGATVVVNDLTGRPAETVCATHGFTYEDHDKGLITMFHTPHGPVGVTGRKRSADGSHPFENYAALFDTQAPTGDDTDLYTTDWGLALIINQDQTNVPNDNQYGGELYLNFAAIGPVTMQSLKALDIDEYEDMSWIYLYDAAGNELYSVQLQPLGNNSKQEVDLGNTSGVMSMKIVLDGRNNGNLAGSGAIDEIRFCVEERPSEDCTTTGFPYADHDTGLISMFRTAFGHVNVMGRKRNPDGTYASENHAALFDTQNPTGDDTDLLTLDWGLALIINQDQTNVPNDNQHGGELILDFSEMGPVTMVSLKALDIDTYSTRGMIHLYDAEGNELYSVRLQPLGDNSRQSVDLGNTSGVMTMRIVFDGTNAAGELAGSGAIDEIRFCIDRSNPCEDEQVDAVVAENDVMDVSISDAVAYPVPFQDNTTIEFRMRDSEDYVVNLYDTKGMLIKQLKAGTAIAGELNKVEVDGRNLSEGLYLARIVSGSGAKTIKLILKR